MNLVAQNPSPSIDVCGFAVAPGSCVIHFYYSPAERQRFAGFLLDGFVAGEVVVLACTRAGYEAMADGLEMVGIRGAESGLVHVEITPDLRVSIGRIAEAIDRAIKLRNRRVRLLADFGSMVSQELIFELEGALSSALANFDVVSVTQYDGRDFAASITIEQFRTHALAIVGNALYQENKKYTSPETYFRKRAAAVAKK
jgi:hypothetical protein